MIAGRLSKTSVSVVLTGNVIKRHLELELDPQEAKAEEHWEARRA
jgi:hypothetical protein